MSNEKLWQDPKYKIENLRNDEWVPASLAKFINSELKLAVAEVEKLRAKNQAFESRKELHDAAVELILNSSKNITNENEKLHSRINYLNDLLNKYALDDFRMREQMKKIISASDDVIRMASRYWDNREKTEDFMNLMSKWQDAKDNKSNA